MTDQARRERILVVDDAPDTREVIRRNLEYLGYEVHGASSVAEAVGFLDRSPVDLVITDLKMPGGSGLGLVRHVRENLADTEVMMITGYATVGGAVEALKTGAQEYLPKPFTDEELAAAARRALDKLRVRRAARSTGRAPGSGRDDLVGTSRSLAKVLEAVARAASTSASVLITGEQGTGKERVARAIHYRSTRATRPFLTVHCGAVPADLLESELFGHVRGGIPGATEARAGFFLAADGGTLFLREVSELPAAAQTRLLRVLQNREVVPVGSSRAKAVDVRVVASTVEDLPALVVRNAFREDLYYRLSVLSVPVPALRDREDDSLLLVRHFLAKHARTQGRPAPQLTDRAAEALRAYSWPGNVRELEALAHRLAGTCDADEIDVPDLPAHMRFSVARDDRLNRTLAEVEQEYVRKVLVGVGGNRTRAAEILGIDRKTLRAKL